VVYTFVRVIFTTTPASPMSDSTFGSLKRGGNPLRFRLEKRSNRPLERLRLTR